MLASEGDLDDDSLRSGTRHGVEPKLDVGVASFDSTGAAIGGLDPADLYIKHIARDLRSLLHLPAPSVTARSKRGARVIVGLISWERRSDS